MSWISGSADTYAPSMQTKTEQSSASLANVGIWSGTLKRAILQAGGIWPPVGTKTTSGPSATAATSRTKDNSGYLVDTSMVSEREKLKKLCSVLRVQQETKWGHCEWPLSIIKRKPIISLTSKASTGIAKQAAEQMAKELQEAIEKTMSSKKYEDADEVTRMRVKRWHLMCKYHAIQWPGKYSHERKKISDNIERLNGYLFQLTGNRRYIDY